MNKKLVFPLIIGGLFSSFALFITFKNVPLVELALYIKTINLWWALPALFFTVVSFIVRVLRWQLILSPVKNKTSFWSAFHPLMLGFMINCILPGRVGEIARPIAFSKKEGVPFTKIFATVGTERLFDVITLLILFIVAMLNVTIDPAIEITFGKYQLNKETLKIVFLTTLQISIILTAIIILTTFNRTRQAINSVILQIPQILFFLSKRQKEKFINKVLSRIVELLNNIAHGFEVIKNIKSVIQCFFLSFLVWGLLGVSFYIMMLGCPGIDITFPEMFTVLILICFFISLPSVPGYWGLFEAGGVFGLLIFGVPAKESAGFILTNHVLQFIPTIIMGIISGIVLGTKNTIVIEPSKTNT